MGRPPQPRRGMSRKAKRPPGRKSLKDPVGKVNDLEKRLAEALEREAEALKLKAEALGRETETLDQQTATGAILRVISTSPTDVQPVFDAVVKSAARFCAAEDAQILRVEGDGLRLVAHHGPTSAMPGSVSSIGGTAAGRAVLERRAVHVADTQAETEEFPEGSAIAREMGWHTGLSVPLLREGVPLGVILLRRTEVAPFSEKQIALLQTFADQAVIAIENVRLFKELEERNRDLVATSEILQVISRSPTNAQPVFEAIAESAALLTNAKYVATFLVADDQLHLAAVNLPGGANREAFAQAYPIPLDDHTLATRIARNAVTANIADMEMDPSVPEPQRARVRIFGARALLGVPMLRDGRAVGMIFAGRAEAGAFADQQVALLETFANQAVIAIENVRLFTELETSNHELTTSLDTQTATADILRVISGSRTDVQPVFDAIAESALRLLRGYGSSIARIVGEQVELAALTSFDPASDAAVRAAFPFALDGGGLYAQVLRERAPLNIADAQTDAHISESGRALARTRGYKSWVLVPLLRQEEAIGAISVSRREPGGFTDDEIALLQTFADQA